MWSGLNLNMGQSVRTVNGAEADSPEDSPVAETVCSPGRAEAGTLKGKENAHEGSVVALPRGEESNDRSTTSMGPNPWPLTVIRVVGGPTAWDSRIRGLAAAREGVAVTRARTSTAAIAATAPRCAVGVSDRPIERSLMARAAVVRR